jgi:hypothetical protein
MWNLKTLLYSNVLGWAWRRITGRTIAWHRR